MSCSAYDVVGAYTCTIFSLQHFVMHRTSSATLGLMLFTVTIMVFHFLFMRKPSPAWALFVLEWYSRWPLCKVVKHSSGLLTS